MKKILFLALSTFSLILSSNTRKRSSSVSARIKEKKEKRKNSRNYKKLQKLYLLAFPDASDTHSTISCIIDEDNNRLLHHLVKRDVSTKHISSALNLGADINTKNALGQPAVFFARTLAMIQFLQQKNADLSIKDTEGNSILHQIAQKHIDGQEVEKIIDFLTKSNTHNLAINLNEKNNAGETPLHLACAVQSPMIKFLCKQEANTNIPNKEGATPIFYLLSSYQRQSVSVGTEPNIEHLDWLIGYGANLRVINKDKQKPIDLAWNENVKKVLKKNMPGQNDSSEVKRKASRQRSSIKVLG